MSSDKNLSDTINFHADRAAGGRLYTLTSEEFANALHDEFPDWTVEEIAAQLTAAWRSRSLYFVRPGQDIKTRVK